MVRTVVLVSTENFVWHSMQEIIPSLEQRWLQSQKDEVHDVKSVNIDQLAIKDYLPLLFAADNIVISCFTFKMAQLTKFFRNELRLKARYIIHLHNQATIACWPFHKFSLGGNLQRNDIFISSCTRDQETLRLGFDQARVECVPFTFSKGMVPDAGNVIQRSGQKDFIYIGRLSVQKNLHTLIWAFSIFLKKDPAYKGKLIFVGGEDNLGSPNMDMKSAGYQEYLQQLVQHFSLQDKIEFTGHMQRDELYKQLDHRDYVFVTPSLHSDENFGMAVFRALVEGRNAVLTDWGGHTDYIHYFKDQVHLVPVYGNSQGPWISPFELARGLELAASKESQGYQLPGYYQANSISEKYYDIAVSKEDAALPLRRSILAEAVLKAREEFSSTSATKIFKSYEDPHVQPFFKVYGMSSFKGTTSTDLVVAPWVSERNGVWHIQDIHRGEFQCDTRNSAKYLQENGWLVDPDL